MKTAEEAVQRSGFFFTSHLIREILCRALQRHVDGCPLSKILSRCFGGRRYNGYDTTINEADLAFSHFREWAYLFACVKKVNTQLVKGQLWAQLMGKKSYLG